ncbi:zinc finger protein 597 [Sorex araneus]|uniref:zinc finger protein 597 n=1 Tax=Sorex araneus TaxID=42254 RepID=UPI0024335AE8|nr:zinc finger protein 597 [Sorex araneus]
MDRHGLRGLIFSGHQQLDFEEKCLSAAHVAPEQCPGCLFTRQHRDKAQTWAETCYGMMPATHLRPGAPASFGAAGTAPAPHPGRPAGGPRQEPLLFEDLAVYFCQEECVSLYPAHRPLCRDPMWDSLEDKTFVGGKGETEVNQQFHLDCLGVEELALETCSTAAPLVYNPEVSPEDGEGNPERKMLRATSACKIELMNLLVTIDNHAPLLDLSQCLGIRAISEFAKEATDLSKCSEYGPSVSDKSCLAHPRGKPQRCDRGKSFSDRASVQAHGRAQASRKPRQLLPAGPSVRAHAPPRKKGKASHMWQMWVRLSVAPAIDAAPAKPRC